MRTTKDMDATLKGISLEKENVLSIMTEILNIDVDDNVSFEINVNAILLALDYGLSE